MGNFFTHHPPQPSWRGRRRPTLLPNPGSFDELHKSCKEVFPQQMEGVKVIINKYLSSHFQVSHHFHMSSIGQSGYHFNAKYIGDQLPGSSETHHSKFLTWQIDVEYRGDNSTGTLTLGNPDIINDSMILVTHFLQSITPRLVLGGELVYHQRMGEEGAILTLAGKYSADNWVTTLNIGYGGAHASYYHKANEQIQVGVEFEANTRLQETSFAFGYHLTIPKANVVFKGSVDSSWCVGAVLEKRLPPLPVTLALGAFMNHWKNKFHCGFNIMVG
ncbi:PREDICTED: mitochondrial import receptor subunit TOM40B isoform X2 [Nanorana parkeri]|uniref:mitochondrial import receptor subunit TOM40B isoform X2 n=1 Tax=Nanorana parkeri TaxID=125878 RepID=UPI000854EB51|nr:PREDICTED: mitochondrial import receptor subunit TOM40B isoform X2 [Nanorana parkeri]